MTKEGQKNAERLVDIDNAPNNLLAELIGVTPRHTSQLSAEGVIANNGRRGKYKLAEAIPRYIGSIRKSGAAEARANLAVQQERKLRIANDKQAGELVPVEEAANAFRQYCLIWRAGANALPRRLATQLSNESNPAAIQRLLSEEFAELFETMEGGLREYFASTGETFTVVDAGPNRESAPAKKNARRVGKRKKNTAVRKRRTRKVAK